jgi:hypothetical protein
MARKIFFSFHYERDIWRVNQIRNSWITQGISNSAAGWIDHATWEEVKKQRDAAIKRWIDNNLSGSSVTVVCIGAETAFRRYVQYEISRSIERGNGIIGIRVHSLKDKEGRVDAPGKNPFDQILSPSISLLVSGLPLSRQIPIFDWKLDNGYFNLADWVERAARAAGK